MFSIAQCFGWTGSKGSASNVQQLREELFQVTFLCSNLQKGETTACGNLRKLSTSRLRYSEVLYSYKCDDRENWIERATSYRTSPDGAFHVTHMSAVPVVVVYRVYMDARAVFLGLARRGPFAGGVSRCTILLRLAFEFGVVWLGRKQERVPILYPRDWQKPAATDLAAKRIDPHRLDRTGRN
jgi:hypothetical protein